MQPKVRVAKLLSQEKISIEIEMGILSHLDFVVPLKEEGSCLRVVIEQLFKFYNPRRLIIISRPEVLERVSRLIQFWDLSASECQKFLFLDELTLLDSILVKDSFNQLKTFYQNLANNSSLNSDKIKRREFGWWYQQIIKLAISHVIVDLSRVYIVWDGDLIVTKRWSLFMLDKDPKNQHTIFNAIPTVAILQNRGKRGAFEIYSKSLRSTLNIDPVIPEGGGTFITHHMVFDSNILNKFFKSISDNCGGLPWPFAIIKISNSALRWSEYLSYASFAINENQLNFHPYQKFGEGGIRIRGGKFGQILTNFFEKNVPMGGYSIQHINKVLMALYGDSARNNTYLQIDHIYGKVPGSDRTKQLSINTFKNQAK